MATNVLTSLYIVKYQYNNTTGCCQEKPMNTTIELVSLIQRERLQDAAQSRLARLAECARLCRTAPANLLDRFARILRRTPEFC
jgi:hypothetical protein